MNYKTLFILCLLLMGKLSHSQKNLSLSIFAGSGFSSFSGKGASSETYYYISDVSTIPN